MEINKQNIDLSGRLVVLGGGESGTGAAVLGKVKGMDVFLSDMGKIPEKYKEMLRNHSIPFEEGQHTEEKILNATVVVKSPGIPLMHRWWKRLQERGYLCFQKSNSPPDSPTPEWSASPAQTERPPLPC